MLTDQGQGYSLSRRSSRSDWMIRIEWRAWTVLAPYLILINVPTGILMDYRSKDITPAIGSVSSSSFTGTHIITPIITMSTVFTSIFNNETRAEGVHSLRAARGSGRHNSMLHNVQSRASRRAAARREVTPFDFNVGRYPVSSSSVVMS